MADLIVSLLANVGVVTIIGLIIISAILIYRIIEDIRRK